MLVPVFILTCMEQEESQKNGRTPDNLICLRAMSSNAAEQISAGGAPPSDEEQRKLLKPAPSNEQVIAALSATYPNKDLTINKQLESYDDVNYLVTDTNDGSQYLAKVHNGVESLDYIQKQATSTSVIDLQNAIFAHLSEKQVKTSVPVPPVCGGGSVVSLHDLPVVSAAHSPSKLVLRLLSWVPGVPMSSVPSLTAETLAEAGVYLGKLRSALDELSATHKSAVQASKRYHAWDGQNTLDLHNFTKYIADDDRRALVTSVLDAFRDTFGSSTGKAKVDFPMGISQGDFNDANIIMNEGKVSGVIDFGDSVYR